MADFARRRGDVQEVHIRDRLRGVTGEVPLAEVRGYATDLRSLTQGKGTFTLEFRRYQIVPDNLAVLVIEERQKKGKISRR
jgi:elongation factor G